MEIKVPITVKGGREGDKVGKQIGDKIANALNKSLKSVGFGGSKSSASASGGGLSQASGFLGLSKGIGAVVKKLGVIGIIAGAALGLMKKSSSYLKGVMSVFGRAFLIFFRPFGDFLAGVLRPMAILMMKMAVAFLKFTRTPFGKKGVGTALGAGGGAIAGAAIGALGGPIGAGAGALIGAGLALLAQIDWKAVYNKMLQFGGWLWENIKKIWNWTADFGGWLWEKITSIWNWTEDFGIWLWDKIKSIWTGDIDLSGWIFNKIESMWTGSWNALTWAKDKIKGLFGIAPDSSRGRSSSGGSSSGGSSSGGSSYFKPIENGYSSLDPNTNTNPNFPKSNPFLDLINKPWKGFATGSRFIGEDGLAMLHRGESVTPRVQNKNSNNQSIVLQPTIQITGGSNIDADEIARQFSNMTMMELKSRGIV